MFDHKATDQQSCPCAGNPPQARRANPPIVRGEFPANVLCLCPSRGNPHGFPLSLSVNCCGIDLERDGAGFVAHASAGRATTSDARCVRPVRAAKASRGRRDHYGHAFEAIVVGFRVARECFLSDLSNIAHRRRSCCLDAWRIPTLERDGGTDDALAVSNSNESYAQHLSTLIATAFTCLSSQAARAAAPESWNSYRNERFGLSLSYAALSLRQIERRKWVMANSWWAKLLISSQHS